MFNKKNTKYVAIAIGFLVIFTVLAISRNKTKLKEQVARDLLNEVLPKESSFSEEELQKGIERWEMVKDSYVDAKKRFEKVKDSYEFDNYIMINDRGQYYGMASYLHDMKFNGPEVFDFDENNTLDYSMSENNCLSIGFRLYSRVKQRTYLPVKGKWQELLLLNKLSSDPNEILPHQTPLLKHNDWLIRGMWAGSSSNEIMTEFHFVSENNTLISQGLYAIQLQFVPDLQLVKSIDGMLKSPVYYLRIRK